MSDQSVDSDQLAQDKAMLGYDISVIAESPFGKTQNGRAITNILIAYNKTGKISYAPTATDDARGEWDGTAITIKDDFRGKALPTIIELVHEGSHVLWRKNHPKKNIPTEKLQADNLADEEVARLNQMTMYLWLRKKYPDWPTDAEMEFRLNK
ncbi:MAG: hypothetical protein FIA97_02920 [Methylococcaceae bacterium]|nr:hypothetical protein [Methylococcaceae bacterium]